MKRIFIAVLGIAVSCSALCARNYFVKTTGLNTLPGTNWPAAWRSVGYAATNASAGDTVIVSNGTYSEEVAPPKNGISFYSFLPYQAVVRGVNYCFHAAGRTNIRIAGFTLKRGTLSCVRLSGASAGNLVANNRIFSNAAYGVQVSSDRASGNIILSNDIRSCVRGVSIATGDYNLVLGNRIYGQSWGLTLSGSATYNHIARNSIYSNDLRGILINEELSDHNSICTNDIWGMNQNTGIEIGLADNNLILSNAVHNHSQCGIYIADNVTGNRVVNNRVFSNATYGMWLAAETADNNHIISNDIWGVDQDVGLYMGPDPDNNVVRGNRIRNNGMTGLWLSGSATNNAVIQNEIFSNNTRGIYLDSDEADNNLILSNSIRGHAQFGIQADGPDRLRVLFNRIFRSGADGFLLSSGSSNNLVMNNFFFSNTTYGLYLSGGSGSAVLENTFTGPGQQYGAGISGSSKNIIAGNRFFGHGDTGMLMDGFSSSNLISQNLMSNNSVCGLMIDSDTADLNSVRSNRFCSQRFALSVQDADRNLVSRNLFKGCLSHGAAFYGTARSNALVNNTFYHTTGNYGAAFTGTASGSMLNNVLLSNASLGVTNSSSGTVVIDYNCFFGHTRGAANTGVLLGARNTYLNPLLNAISNFALASSTSPACDSATNIPPVTDGYFGPAPDMGWKELIYTAVSALPPETNSAVRTPDADVLVYNNLLDLSGSEPARIIFGVACNAEIRIYGLRGVLVRSWESRGYAPGEYQEWDGTVGESGKKAGAGVYFVLIKGDINKKLKLIIKK